MRTSLAVLVAKTVQWAMKGFGYRAGTLPGRLALMIDPQLFAHLSYPKERIFITGTNGKTSVNNITSQLLIHSGYAVVCNHYGDNLDWGLASTMIDKATLSGRLKGDILCCEVDELTVVKLVDVIHPTMLVINNFFRDQLDRVGEMDTLIALFEKKLQSYTGRLILNSNDPNVNRLALSAPLATRLNYGVEPSAEIISKDSEIGEGTRCPLCFKELVYSARYYSHIGVYACPEHTDLMRRPDLLATQVSLSENRFVLNGETYPLMYNLTYSVFNQLAALSVASCFDVDPETARQVFASFRLENGRMESFTIREGRNCILNLAKNPAGASEIIKFVRRYNHDHVLLSILNDNDADGTDVSWIWDTPYQDLITPSTQMILCSGKRAYDMAIRFRYTGFDMSRIAVIEDKAEAVKALSTYDMDSFVLSNYTALQATRKELEKIAL